MASSGLGCSPAVDGDPEGEQWCSRPSENADVRYCLDRLPSLAGAHTATRSDPDLRFLNRLGMNLGSAFNLHAVIRFGDKIRHVVGQESAGLALP